MVGQKYGRPGIGTEIRHKPVPLNLSFWMGERSASVSRIKAQELPLLCLQLEVAGTLVKCSEGRYANAGAAAAVVQSRSLSSRASRSTSAAVPPYRAPPHAGRTHRHDVGV
jgi:hypothetical protein